MLLSDIDPIPESVFVLNVVDHSAKLERVKQILKGDTRGYLATGVYRRHNLSLLESVLEADDCSRFLLLLLILVMRNKGRIFVEWDHVANVCLPVNILHVSTVLPDESLTSISKQCLLDLGLYERTGTKWVASKPSMKFLCTRCI